MKSLKHMAVAIVAAGTITAALAGTTSNLHAAAAAATPAPVPPKISKPAQTSAHAQALATLNSFYKPALKGQFPSFNGFTVGVTTKEAVIKAIGKAPEPGKDSDAFDVYHAEMGHPGYAISYKLDRIREMRYFGTNVERQTNIGGITQSMLIQQWGAPSSSASIKSGKVTQKKITYVRGNYKLDFIFNSSTNLDHINLSAK